MRLQPLGHLSVLHDCAELPVNIVHTPLGARRSPDFERYLMTSHFGIGYLCGAMPREGRVIARDLFVHFRLTFLGFMQLLCEIVFVGYLFDRVQLPFQPIDVMFFIEQDLFE